jgi:acetate kinase
VNVLVVNCDSASARFAVVDVESGHELVAGRAEWLGTPQAAVSWEVGGQRQGRAIPGAGHEGGVRAIVELVRELGLAGELAAVGHRVVHGGARFTGSLPIGPDVLDGIRACTPLSPLHNPPSLVGIEVAQELLPHLPQVAVFDTAFHHTMPPRAFLYAVPYEWFERHQVRRYGFHGTSHRFISERAVQLLGLDPRDSALVTAHLGNGCSLAAVRDGRSMDTTMGLTPVDGVVMGTRCGAIDPSIVTHMKAHLPGEEVVDALNRRSGLLGLSGLSHDMRVLRDAADRGHERATLAIEKFCYSVAKATVGLVVALGRLDALVFTGGIGENADFARGRIIELLGMLGLVLDPELNAVHGRGHGGRISRSLRPQALVVPTNEQIMIALDTAEVVRRSRGPASA